LELAHDLNGSCLRAYLTVGEDDPAGMRKDASIGQGDL
jgi:hypothetical protein